MNKKLVGKCNDMPNRNADKKLIAELRSIDINLDSKLRNSPKVDIKIAIRLDAANANEPVPRKKETPI